MKNCGSKQPPLGLECRSPDSLEKRFNLDLKRGRYDEGEGWRRVSEISDTRVVIRGPNPDMLHTPYGPVFASSVLDRVTLALTDETLIPDRGIERRVDYQCRIVPMIDFKAGRAF